MMVRKIAISRGRVAQGSRRKIALMSTDWRALVTVDPNVCHGQACVAGTRIPVSVVLDNLAAGVSESEIIASYPRLTHDAIQACIAYAADLAREEVLPFPV